MRGLFFVLVPLALTAADALRPEDILLARVRVHMAQTLARMPNYTCLQTIERMTRHAPKKKFELVDMVRLEVALVNGKELFSWPGAGKFDDRNITDMVTGGAIGNGNFALHAKSIFQSRGPVFEYLGEQMYEGRKALRWNFRVAPMVSGYTLRVPPETGIVGYTGAFWVDPASLDLIRLEVKTREIPPNLPVESASDAVEYQRVPIAGQPFLLPRSSEMSITDIGGSESRNRTRFSGCRQYTGESVLTFDDPPAGATAPAGPPWQIDVRRGVRLELMLETPISDAQSAVGDPVTAKLTRAANLGEGVVAPKGAFAHGRITLLRKQNGARPVYVVGLQFFELEFGNVRGRMETRLEHLAMIDRHMPSRNAGSSFPQAAAHLDVPGSVFFVTGYQLKLDRGLKMSWVTEALPPEGKS